MSFSRTLPNFCNIAPQTIKVALINSGTLTMGSESWSEVSKLESLPRYGTKRDFPLGNEKRRFVETLRNVKLISNASIAARTILIGLLYWNAGLGSPNQPCMLRSEKFFQLFFFPTFSILLKSQNTRRKWTPRTLVPIQNCFQIFDWCFALLLAFMIRSRTSFGCGQGWNS